MMFHAHITTENQADPVTIEGDSEQTLPVMLRIRRPGTGLDPVASNIGIRRKP